MTTTSTPVATSPAGESAPPAARRSRGRSLGLHGLWLGLVLSTSRLDRWLTAKGAPSGAAVPAVVLPWYALLAVMERRTPFRSDWNPDAPEIRTDTTLLATSIAAALTGQAVGASAVRRLRRRRPSGNGSSPTASPVGRLGVGGGVIASVLTSDFIHYWLHRLGHEWGPAWQIHAVHHSPERLHIYNATRFHPTEQFVEGILEGLALEVAGFTPAQHLTHSAARGSYGQLQHANIDLDSGAVDHVMATPDLHRWHHSTIYAEGDNNYGSITSLWDRAFGTFFRPARDFDAELGVGRMPDFPQTLRGLLSVPFRWQAIKQRNADTWYGTRESNPDVHERS